MLTTPVTGPLVWIAFIGVAAAAWIARRRKLRAEEESIESWAAAKGYPESDVMLGDTPVLRADNARPGPAFAVPVSTSSGALFPFSYSIGSGRDRHDVDTTVVQADVTAQLPSFSVIPRHANDLPYGPFGENEMDLESVEFHHDHKLVVDRHADRTVLERVFDPETIVWFINLGPDAPVVEYAGGTLAVVARRCCMTGADCDTLLGQAQYMAGRLQAAGVSQPA
jgi:hypothetical protein